MNLHAFEIHFSGHRVAVSISTRFSIGDPEIRGEQIDDKRISYWDALMHAFDK